MTTILISVAIAVFIVAAIDLVMSLLIICEMYSVGSIVTKEFWKNFLYELKSTFSWKFFIFITCIVSIIIFILVNDVHATSIKRKNGECTCTCKRCQEVFKRFEATSKKAEAAFNYLGLTEEDYEDLLNAPTNIVKKSTKKEVK